MADGKDRSGQVRLRWLRGDLPGWVQAVLAVLAFLGLGSGGAAVIHAVRSQVRQSTPPAKLPPTRLPRPVYLDMLPETTGDPVIPGQVSIGGRTYQHGVQFTVGGEPTSEANYSIPDGARTFAATIGNDDNQSNSFWDQLSLLYEVFVDGRRVATAHAHGRAHDPLLQARIAGGSTITLKVTNLDQIGGTNADWADPVFR